VVVVKDQVRVVAEVAAARVKVVVKAEWVAAAPVRAASASASHAAIPCRTREECPAWK
jgi:hypothetical protein